MDTVHIELFIVWLIERSSVFCVGIVLNIGVVENLIFVFLFWHAFIQYLLSSGLFLLLIFENALLC